MRAKIYLTLLFIVCPPCLSGVSDVSDPAELSLAKEAMLTDLDQAEQYIEQALNKAPNDPHVHFVCGRIMGKQTENAIFSALSYAKRSLNCLKRAVALQPHNTDFRKALMHFYLGVPGIAGGDKALAWQQVEKITAIDKLQGTLAELAYYRETAQSSQYELLLERSRHDYPEQPEFHYRFGLALQHKKHYAAAFEAFYSATNTPTSADNVFSLNAYYQIGRTAVFSKQKLAPGIEALNYYLANSVDSPLLPEKPWAHLRLAQLHRLKGDEGMMNHHITLARASDDKALLREISALQH